MRPGCRYSNLPAAAGCRRWRSALRPRCSCPAPSRSAPGSPSSGRPYSTSRCRHRTWADGRPDTATCRWSAGSLRGRRG
eukprot:12908917-Prorocentrum_lima.AAC.1